MLKNRARLERLERRMRANGGQLAKPPKPPVPPTIPAAPIPKPLRPLTNPVCVHKGIAYIILGTGLVALVDEVDYPLVSETMWTVQRCRGGRLFYAVESGGIIRMHNVVAGSKWFDHKNLNGLDNRRENLRQCTAAQNTYNRRKPRRGDSTSQYKGVSGSSRTSRFFARIAAERKIHYIGSFPDETSAARAYDAKARELHGEFALLNFPEETA